MMQKPSDSTASDVGQLLFIGIEGEALTPATRRLLADVRPGGVILFRRNAPSLPELAALCDGVRQAMEPAPLLAIDEEGGRVTRLSPHVTGLPAAATIAGVGPRRLAAYWESYGRLLRILGMDIDFAPVLDLCLPDAANGIAERSFGTDPALVTACAGAVGEGLRKAGIMPTLKHFPGLGPTLLDSHHRLPTVTGSREQFEAADLAPWRKLAPAAEAIMIAHGHYPFYSGADRLAATLSKEVSTTLLRESLGFRGTAISDDLEMKAVADRVPWEELAPRVVEAGSDMLLVCHKPERIRGAFDALRRRADADPSFASRCEVALRRIRSLRESCAAIARPFPPSDAPGGSSPGRIEEARAALVQAAGEISAPVA